MGRKIIFDFAVLEKVKRPAQSRKRYFVIAGAVLVASTLIAVAFLPDPSSSDGTTQNEQPKPAVASTNQADTPPAIVNGITVVTPRLLVPSVSADAAGETLSASVPKTRAVKPHSIRRYARVRFVVGRSLPPFFNPIPRRVARF